MGCATPYGVATDRLSPVSRKDPQINIRLAPDREAILRAAAFVHGKATSSALVHELVEEAIDRYAKLPTVRDSSESARRTGGHG